jgi:hypothetical protein
MGRTEHGKSTVAKAQRPATQREAQSARAVVQETGREDRGRRTSETGKIGESELQSLIGFGVLFVGFVLRSIPLWGTLAEGNAEFAHKSLPLACRRVKVDFPNRPSLLDDQRLSC